MFTLSVEGISLDEAHPQLARISGLFPASHLCQAYRRRHRQKMLRLPRRAGKKLMICTKSDLIRQPFR